jgi:multidrug efflux pump
LPGGSNFPIEFVIASTGDSKELLDFGWKVVGEAMKTGDFNFMQVDLSSSTARRWPRWA